MKTTPDHRGAGSAAVCALRPAAVLALAGACLLTTTSCNFAPSYKRPDTAAPAAFKETPAAADSQSSEWKAAQPRDDAERAKWWEIYQDPELNALEEQVNISNQSIKLAEANFRSSRAMVVGAKASYFPTVSAAPSYTRSRSSANTSSSRGTTSTTSTGTSTTSSGTTGTTVTTNGGNAGQTVNNFDIPFEATYTVDLWGKVRNTVSASEFTALASAADLATARLSTHAELAQDYFQLRALDEQKRILDDTVNSYRSTLNLTQSLYKNGIDSEEDVSIAQTSLDQVVAQASDVGVARAQYEHAIAVLVGKPPAALAIAPAPFAPKVPSIPPLLPSELLERRPDIAAAERRVESANAEIGVARTAYFPSLTLNATGGFQSSTLAKLFDWPSRFWSIGPQLGATIFPWSELRAVNEEAKANYDATVATYRQTVLGAFQGVEDNLAALRILGAEEGLQLTAVTSAKRYLDLATNRYQNGIDSALNLATAQNSVLTTRETAVQVQLRHVDASIALIVALGGGWDDQALPQKKDLTLGSKKD